MKTFAIIPSAGKGLRMGPGKKNYLPLLGTPVLAHTIGAFESCRLVDSIVVVTLPEDAEFFREEIAGRYGFKKIAGVVPGGEKRQDSVANALNSIKVLFNPKENSDIILVHDGARPLVTAGIIEDTVKEAQKHGAAVSAVRVKDTIKEVSGGFVKKTIPREPLWAVQTPQAFKAGLIIKAFDKAVKDGFTGTDESALVERLGAHVSVVPGTYENIKITTPEDLLIAECILKNRTRP